MKKRIAPEPLENILRRFFRSHGQEQKLNELKVFERWEEAVGPEIARNAQPLSVHNGWLAVKVRNSIWLSELGFEKQKLKSRLNRLLGKGTITDLTFRIGTLDEPRRGSSEKEPAARTRGKKLDRKLETLLLAVDDPQLREQLKDLLIAARRK